MISAVKSPMKAIAAALEMIKFEHTIFAMPFALMSAVVAASGFPSWPVMGWILVAMVGARSAAMAFNRLVDRKIDALNPRTSNRALVTGEVSALNAWGFVVVGSAALILAAHMLNPLASMLWPVALAAILGYSLSKRFTSLSHLWLGLCLGIAPVGAWIAVTGEIGFSSMVLSAAVMLWTAGFDIIYSLQDVEFDRKNSLFSLPAKIGATRALLLARLFHALMVALVAWFGLLNMLGGFYCAGVLVITAFLIYEHSLVSATDTRRVNTAFFTMNGLVSIVLFVLTLVDVLR